MTGVLRIVVLCLLVAAPLLGADQVKKRNYDVCLKGLPECDREMLTWSQRPSVKRADTKRRRLARKRSFRACQGKTSQYPCDLSLLKPKQYAKVGGEDYLNHQRQTIGPISEPTRLDTAPRSQPNLSKQPAQRAVQVQRPPPSNYRCAENGSCYGDISTTTGRPKTVRVKGYYRKDGTYVRGHYRSRPK